MSNEGHECGECIFVASKEDIYVRAQILRDAATVPVFINFFTLPGWRGHSAFYIFRCPHCRTTSVDYPHGYTDFGLLFLNCDECKKVLPLKVPQNKEIYERERLPLPPSSKRKRKGELNKAADEVFAGRRVRVIDSRGIRLRGEERKSRVGRLLRRLGL